MFVNTTILGGIPLQIIAVSDSSIAFIFTQFVYFEHSIGVIARLCIKLNRSSDVECILFTLPTKSNHDPPTVESRLYRYS